MNKYITFSFISGVLILLSLLAEGTYRAFFGHMMIYQPVHEESFFVLWYIWGLVFLLIGAVGNAVCDIKEESHYDSPYSFKPRGTDDPGP